jgi:hypothetical protein
VHVKRWVDESRFSGEKFQKVNLFDSERMFCDIYCFEPGQEQALHSHADNDKIYHVIEGQGTLPSAPNHDSSKLAGRFCAPPARITASSTRAVRDWWS